MHYAAKQCNHNQTHYQIKRAIIVLKLKKTRLQETMITFRLPKLSILNLFLFLILFLPVCIFLVFRSRQNTQQDVNSNEHQVWDVVIGA